MPTNHDCNTFEVPEGRQAWLRTVKPGMDVTRMLAGVVPMRLTVTEADAQRIRCGDWLFDRNTGAEIDPELGWGTTITGSFLISPEEETKAA